MNTEMNDRPNWEMDLLRKNRFYVKAPYDPSQNVLFKEQGGKWEKDHRSWSFSLTLPIVNDVTDIGRKRRANFLIGPDLKKWVQQERKRIANIIAVDDGNQNVAGLLKNVRETHPNLYRAMESRPYQLIGAEFMARQRSVLMADQPGMGKTIQTLASIVENQIFGPILVVAPRTAANVTWPAEIARWLGPDEDVKIINGAMPPAQRRAILETAYDLQCNSRRTWILCGPNYLRIRADTTEDGSKYLRDEHGKKIVRVVREGRPELFNFLWSAVIVDESHQTLAGATGNIKKQSSQRQGLGALRVKDDGMRIALSGTPFRGKAHYMWGQIDWIEPERRLAYWQWIERHFGTERGTFGVIINERIKDEKAFYLELKPLMVRRTKTEVVKDLPPKTYGGEPLDVTDPTSPIAVWLDMLPEQQKQYRLIESHALLEIKDRPDMPVNGILAGLVRLKQVANSVVTLMDDEETVDSTPVSNKMDWILEFVEERMDAGTKVIIASQFTKFIYTLSSRLNQSKFNHYLLTGRQNDTERQKAQNEFQSEKGHGIFLLNTKAGGVSLTLDAADDVVIVDSTFNPDDQEQVEDRAHRVSRMHNVTIWNLCSRGTIDEHIARLTTDREMATKGIIDGQRGVSLMKIFAESYREKALAS